MTPLLWITFLLSLLCSTRIIHVQSAPSQEIRDAASDPIADYQASSSGRADEMSGRLSAGDTKLRARNKRDKPTEEYIKKVLDRHNELRRSEGAADMKEVVWSECLADLADILVSKCKYDHGHPSRDNLIKDNYGQNLHYTSAKDEGSAAIVGSVDLYYGEKRDYNNATRTCAEGKMCSHYTQVVWAKTQYVGCAFKKCDMITDNNGLNMSPGTLSCCNYYPTGNYGGGDPYVYDQLYEAGEACSKCPQGSTCNNGLCNVTSDPQILQGCPSGSSPSGSFAAPANWIPMMVVLMMVTISRIKYM